MPAKDWEDAFTSLDLMRGASISKASIHDLGQPQLPALSLYACVLDGHRLPVSLSDTGDAWTFSLGDIPSPITHLVLEDGSGQEVLRIDDLMPQTDEEYEQSFRSASRRSKEPHLNFFIARQMVLHFPGRVSYRISAAVVALYKAIEIQDPEYLDWAESLLELTEDLLPLAPVARSPRRNREHLRVSLWCAEWHFRLARNDIDGFLQCLQRVRRYMEDEILSNYFNVAYPANMSLSVLCLYLTAVGKRNEARSVMKLTFSLFQRSVRDADTTMAHFRELAVIHKATYECLSLIKDKGDITEKRAKQTLQRAVRIDPSSQAFASIWSTLKNGLGL